MRPHRVASRNQGTDMISRTTARAACFAILSAATLSFAAAGHHPLATPSTLQAVAIATPAAVVHLPQVLVIGRRTPR